MTQSAYDMLRNVATSPEPDGAAAAPSSLPLSALQRDPTQPRQKFDEPALGELAESIKKSGIIEPLVVSPDADHPGTWTILVGERRYRAAEKAGLREVPVIVRPGISDVDRLVLQLTENLQRSDLTLRETAEGYLRLQNLMPDKRDRELAEMLGKTRSSFAATLLAAKVTAGPALEALDEDLIRDPDALRIYLSLPQEDQRKLLSTARTSGVTLSRPMLKRFKDTKQKPSAQSVRTSGGGRTSPEPPEPDHDEHGSDAQAHASPAPAAGPSSREAGSSPTERRPSPPPKGANEYLAALTWRHWQILFDQLGIPLPEDPDDAGYTLLEFLEAHAAQA
ncbi:MAG: ParB/RepB/Spo0J family partition protein [Acidobacteria bacterium]|nr:ParB/RepB/Spo0J family partition protein [Acidobacteriota bacterium]